MPNPKIGPDHYRYREELVPSGIKIVRDRYIVIGETPKCWYVIHDYYQGYVGYEDVNPFARDLVARNRKRVLKQQDFGRRYCYSDPKLALHSYRERKRFQLARLELQMSVCKHVSEALANEELEAAELIPLGHSEYTSKLSWGDW